MESKIFASSSRSASISSMYKERAAVKEKAMSSPATPTLPQPVPLSHWISCRFCTLVLPASDSGIGRVTDHEFQKHPEEWNKNKQSNLYKIFNLKEFKVDARPKHPLLKTIMKLNKFMSTTKRIGHTTDAQFPESKTAAAEHITIDLNSDSDEHESRMVPVASTSRRSPSSEGPPPIPSPVPTLSSYNAAEYSPKSKQDRTCTYCFRVFKFPSVLRIHLKSCSVYSCLRRGKAVKAGTSSGLGASTTAATIDGSNTKTSTPAPNTSNTCSICSKYFIDAGNLRKHMSLHGGRSGQRGLSCKFCTKQFRNSILLDQHINTYHDKERPYNCSHCTAKFGTQAECNDHVHRTHSAAGSRCTEVTAPSTPAPTSTGLTCELCSTQCLNRVELISHRAIVHRISAQPFSSNSTSDNIHELINIDVEEDQVQSQSSEVIGPEAPRQNVVVPDLPEQSNGKNFKCSICRALYSTRHGLLFHMNEKHKGGRFKCRFCPSVFEGEVGVVRHEKVKHWNQKLRLERQERAEKEQRERDKRDRPNLTTLTHTPSESDKTVESSSATATSASTSKLESKCRFCTLWFSDRPKRLIHERRSHTDELANILMKRNEVMERENPTIAASAPNSPPSILPDPVAVVTTNVYNNTLTSASASKAPAGSGTSSQINRAQKGNVNDHESRIHVEEIEVEVKPECLNEYLDESGAGAGVVGPNIPLPSLASQTQDALTHLISAATHIPLKTSAPIIIDDDPLGNPQSNAGTDGTDVGFWCQFCDQRFAVFLDLTVHLDHHEYCAVCEKKFQTGQRYRQHLLSDHDKIKKLFCQTCCAAFIDLYAYCQHSLYVHGVRVYPTAASTSATHAAPAPAMANSSTSMPPRPMGTATQQYDQAPTHAHAQVPPSVPVPRQHVQPTSGATATHSLGSIGNVRVTACFECSACRTPFSSAQELQVHFINYHTQARATPVVRTIMQTQTPPTHQVQGLRANGPGVAPTQYQHQHQYQQQLQAQQQALSRQTYHPYQHHQFQQQQQQPQQRYYSMESAMPSVSVHHRPAPPPPPAYQIPRAASAASTASISSTSYSGPATSFVASAPTYYNSSFNPSAPSWNRATGATATAGGGPSQPLHAIVNSSSLMCDLCGLRTSNSSELVRHRINKHSIGASETINQMINDQTIASNVPTSVIVNPASAIVQVEQQQYQQQQPQPQANNNTHTQIHHQQMQRQPLRDGSETLEITQVRLVSTQNSNSNQMEYTNVNDGSNDDCVIVQEHIQNQQQQQQQQPMSSVPNQHQPAGAGNQNLLQHLQRYLNTRSMMQQQQQQVQPLQQMIIPASNPQLSHLLSLPPLPVAPTQNQGQTLAPAFVTNQTTQIRSSTPHWCAYCQKYFDSRPALVQHCFYEHGMHANQ